LIFQWSFDELINLNFCQDQKLQISSFFIEAWVSLSFSLANKFSAREFPNINQIDAWQISLRLLYYMSWCAHQDIISTDKIPLIFFLMFTWSILSLLQAAPTVLFRLFSVICHKSPKLQINYPSSHLAFWISISKLL